MAGYRQNSYDPYTYERPGPPLRPYNWVQWIGVGIAMIGLALAMLHFAVEFGLISGLPDPGAGFISLALLGSILINSRRQGTGQNHTASRRTLIAVAFGLVAFAIALAAVIVFQGA